MIVKVRQQFWTVVFALLLCVSASWAQQTDPRANPPAPPQGPLSPGQGSSKAPNQGGARAEPEPPLAMPTPDARPLSGVEQFTLGQMGKRRSYLLPSFEFFESADTNSSITSTNSGTTTSQSNVDAVTTLLGRMSLQRIWSRYQLTADFTGGGYLYDTRSDLNSLIDQFSLSQRINWRRWSLLLGDRVSYLPEASFGFSGPYYSGLPGTTPVNFNPLFEPNQSILTARSSRLSNSVVGEVDFNINPRSSVTASGAYEILRFPGASFIDSSNAVFSTGYNYSLTQRDTLALTYGLSLFRFGGTSQRIQNHRVHAAYGRRITGRLALQLSAGPEIARFTDQVTGPGTRVSWGMESSLLYRYPRTTLGISYTNYLSGGAGVLTGAQSQVVEMTVDRQLSRVWTGSLIFGFAHNRALSQTTAGPTIPVFNSGYAGVNLNRPFGRYMNLYLSYALQRQSSNTGPCTVGICGNVPLRHHFGLGFNWHLRPIMID